MQTIAVNEEYQSGYSYTRDKPPGQHFHPDFHPELTPRQMLQLGVFGGNYFKERPKEFPPEWFEGITLLADRADANLNYFQVNASQPLHVWQQKGWINEVDPLGWFLWYCRYYMGRRLPDEDDRQIKRWHAFRRHKSQVQNFCTAGDITCRRRQRQALLHWAYDSRSY